MSDGDLVQLGEALATARVVCVGDVMLDRFVYGQVERVSPEAPIPVSVGHARRDELGRRRECFAQSCGNWR